MSAPSLGQILFEAARPRTLPAGLAPVVTGTALAMVDGGFHLLACLCAVSGALAIQIGTNYANDYFDNEKGADTVDRVGPRRATQAGLVTPATMRRAFVAAFAIAVVFGCYLVARGGWPVTAIGVSAVVCGVLYTGGPRPLGYLGLGDVFVLVFFGPVAVAGTHYVQTLAFSPLAAVAGLAPGLLSTGILTVNNLRDRHTDVGANKRTLAVRFGATFARVEYTVVIVAGLVTALVTGLLVNRGALLVLLCVPMAFGLVRRVWTTDGPSLNPMLGATGKLLLLMTATSTVGLLQDWVH